jgi:hypothetical protein
VRGQREIIESHNYIKGNQDWNKREITTISGDEIQVYHHLNEGEDCDRQSILMLMGTSQMEVAEANPTGST